MLWRDFMRKNKKEMSDAPSSPPVAGVTFVVPIEAFRSETVIAAISASGVVDNNDADTRMRAAFSSARDAGDASSVNALHILAGMMSYHFVADSRAEPFRAIATYADGQRTIIPNDFLSEQVEILAQLGSDIGHVALRARVNDVCWLLNRKNADAGLRAIDAYVACVKAVLNGEAKFDFDENSPASVPACEFLRRATIVARSMGWTRSEFNSLRTAIDDVSQWTMNEDDAWGYIRIGPINLDNGVWDNETAATAAEVLATSSSITADYPAQRLLWELAARAHHREKEEANEQRCLISAAETFVREADARRDSAMAESSFLNDAIQALRPIPGTAERRRQLQDRLNEVQPRILDEMSSFSHQQDITELVKSAEAHVTGKSLAEAIRACLTCARSPDPEALRKEVLENAHGSISGIMPVTVSDSQGRTRFKAPGLSFDGPPDENQVRYLVSQHDRFRRQFVVAGSVDPIRRKIMDEHCLSIEALMPIVQASWFVPRDHELAFAKGALRFFAGDDFEPRTYSFPNSKIRCAIS